MTLSTNSIANENCPICSMTYTDTEREDMAKVVELACHHFYHIDCITPEYIRNEAYVLDLPCYSCNQISMPKKEYLFTNDRQIFSHRLIEKRLAELEQRGDLRSHTDVVNCLAQLKSISQSIAILFNDMIYSSVKKDFLEWMKAHFPEWLQNNIPKESQPIAILLLLELHPLRIISEQFIENSLTEIEQNPDFGSRPDIVNHLVLLKSLANSIANLFNDLIQALAEGTPRYWTKIIFSEWVKNNIQEASRPIATKLIEEILVKKQTLGSLEQEIVRLGNLPFEKWPTEIREEGVPIDYKVTESRKIRIRISKEYLQKATYFHLFENTLHFIEKMYHYDPEVLEGIQNVKNLQKDMSRVVIENLSLPMEEMIFLLEENIVKKVQLNDDSKQTLRLIINEFFLNRGALRTLPEEVNRWRKESFGKWPEQIKKNGVRFLFEDRVVMWPANYFILLVQALKFYDKIRRIYTVLRTPLVAVTVGTVAIKILLYARRDLDAREE